MKFAKVKTNHLQKPPVNFKEFEGFRRGIVSDACKKIFDEKLSTTSIYYLPIIQHYLAEEFKWLDRELHDLNPKVVSNKAYQAFWNGLLFYVGTDLMEIYSESKEFDEGGLIYTIAYYDSLNRFFKSISNSYGGSYEF